MVTQYDIECLHNIEAHISKFLDILLGKIVRMCSPIETTLKEYPVSENKALKHINLITITRREVELVCGVLCAHHVAMTTVYFVVTIEIRSI